MTRYAAAFGLLAVILLSAAPAHAASKATFLGPIVPTECHCSDQKVEDTGQAITTAPDYGCVLQVVQNTINFGITLSTILFTIYIVIAGFGLITSRGNPEALNKAKARITNVLVGLAVLLCSWLIVDYVMKTLYDQGKFGPWNAILAGDTSGKDRCIVAKNPKAITEGIVDIVTGTSGGVGSTASEGVPGVTSGTVYSDAQTRSALRSAGISITNWSATRTMANTRADTVNQVIAIKQACHCSVQVNATTGGSHQAGATSHAAGYKVDLQGNAGIDTFLKNLRYGGTRGKSTSLYYDRCGNEYAREPGSPGHWDITVSKGVCAL